ncbi:hypothetical protein P43SY_007976 [Pythium insidiosum]|uniref:Uncharacterized protein n=1 Tax=Pythium insidiosum TaxID=114742 RepID=A0AAD5LXY7_PYTIN|nr:hypothetical protein P43SY_007976 [Pythium insidiosum]
MEPATASLDVDRQLLYRHRRYHSALQRWPWSWSWFLIHAVAYALMLSDTLRSGLAYRSFEQYRMLEPSQVQHFGPYAYPVLHLTRTNATPSALIPLWPYKHDSTSVALRAVAHHLRVQSWQPLLKYTWSDDKRELRDLVPT